MLKHASGHRQIVLPTYRCTELSDKDLLISCGEIDVFGKCLAVLQLQPVFVVFSSIRIVVQSWLLQNPFGPLRINAHVGAGADQARQNKWNNIYKLLGVQRPCLSSSHTMRHSDTPQTPSVWDSQ